MTTTSAICLLVLAFAFVLPGSEAIYGDATYYNPSAGLTSCGTQQYDSEMVAAIPYRFFTTPNPNLDPMCHRKARVTNPTNGASVVVLVRDKCGGCKTSGIDLSPVAFEAIQPGGLGVGRFKVNWDLL